MVGTASAAISSTETRWPSDQVSPGHSPEYRGELGVSGCALLRVDIGKGKRSALNVEHQMLSHQFARKPG